MLEHHHHQDFLNTLLAKDASESTTPSKNDTGFCQLHPNPVLKGSTEPSRAKSLTECTEELLTMHQLKAPPLLRKTLHSTNPIESMFSQVSTKMGRIKAMKKGKMAQRWVATALLDAEKRFRTVKGHLQIQEMKNRIETLQKHQAMAV